MEDVLGGRTTPEQFSSFLANWDTILTRRVDQAVAVFSAIDGVQGLILAGSIGRGEPWPLSDIDFLPIYTDGITDSAQDQIERERIAMLADWINDGWWTGLDIGRLTFTRGEILHALTLSGSNVTTLLQDDRWYYSIDKGYGGRAVFDPDGLASALVNWFAERRFDALTVRQRLTRASREAVQARLFSVSAAERGDELGATTAVRSATNWLMTWQLEQWGERDISQGRVGTRFDRLAQSFGRADLVNALHELNNLSDIAVDSRMASAPDWVWERHDRSFCARHHVGEEITRIEDARDTLRVCALYESRHLLSPPYPDWLAIPADLRTVQDNARRLSITVDHWLSGQFVPATTDCRIDEYYRN